MRYLENVLGKDNSFWKYIVVIFVTMIAMSFIGGILTVIAVFLFWFNQGADFSAEMFSDVKSLYELGLPENFVFVLMLVPSVIGMVTLWMLVGGMHKRTFSMTVNGGEKIRWNHIFTGFSFWFLLMIAFFGINYIADPDNFVFRFDGGKFISLLVISLLFIPFQATFEEYMFRGYLAQGVAAWTKNRLLTICIPGLLFGLMHYSNTEVEAYGFWALMPQYIIFGLFFGLIAVLDDGIELPVGIHIANNLFTCLFVTNEASSLRTPAIFSQTTINHFSATVGLVIAVFFTLLFFYRKYKWNLNILNKKIRNEKTSQDINSIEYK
ncbi:MAG: CPBP family intramembrane metalloprotease [Prevotellaceae bacterium]|jgi:membrane protease YdiL (CAAX protease family)|nr:CPBP family intramembrane metalloprotease [Prevotellaceae bacterium]